MKTIKVVMLGDTGSGKTSILNRYEDPFGYDNMVVSTIGIDYKFIKFEDNYLGPALTLQICDSTGQTKFLPIIDFCLRQQQFHIAVIVFDLADFESFNYLINYWLPLAQRYFQSDKIILVGNKSDLPQRVQQKEIEELCQSFQIKYHTCSSRFNKGVTELISTIVEEGITNPVTSNLD